MQLRTQIYRTWFRLSRPMTLGVRAIVEDRDGRILLVRHTYVDGLFLPGGGVERGEPAEHALERELVEEAGVKLQAAPALVGIYSNHKIFRNDHVLLYRVYDWQQVAATSRGEIAERLWVDPGHLPDDATAATRRRVVELYGDEGPDLYW